MVKGKDKSGSIKQNTKGFTLVELVIVVGILAILALLLIPRIASYTSEAKNSRELANARLIAGEVSSYNALALLDGTDTIPVSLPDAGAIELTNDMLDSTSLALADVKDFPDSTIVKIMIDSYGNASLVH